MKNLSYPSLALALLPLLSACGIGRSERVDLVSEREPNDLAADANNLGALRPGDRVRINGCVCDSFIDSFDGFAFYSVEPILVEVELVWGSPFADLDLCVFEPGFNAPDEFTFCFDSPLSFVESGTFEVDPDSDFHLVVDAFTGQTNYTLYVNAYSRPNYGRSTSTEAPEAGSESERDVAPALLEEASPKGDPRARFEEYRGPSVEAAEAPADPTARAVRGELLSIDPATGAATRMPLVGIDTDAGAVLAQAGEPRVESADGPAPTAARARQR